MPTRNRRKGVGTPAPPWWLFVILALVAFVLLHWLAQPITPPKDAKGLPGFLGASALSAVAGVFQYLLPLALLVLAAMHATASRIRTTPEFESRPAPPDAPPTVRAEVATDQWSLGLLKILDWKRFEEICAAYFETLGFRSLLAVPGADGGVDIHLYTKDGATPAIVVQCKAWRERDVEVNHVRELYGVMAAAKIDEGIFVTTSGYTREARRFAEGKNIHLIDGSDFLEKLKALSSEHRDLLLRLATAGDYTTPTCPSCGIKFVSRTARIGGGQFWGCSNYPQCRTTMRMRTA